MINSASAYLYKFSSQLSNEASYFIGSGGIWNRNILIKQVTSTAWMGSGDLTHSIFLMILFFHFLARVKKIVGVTFFLPWWPRPSQACNVFLSRRVVGTVGCVYKRLKFLVSLPSYTEKLIIAWFPANLFSIKAFANFFARQSQSGKYRWTLLELGSLV